MKDGRWLLLIHQLPPKPDYLRVKMRRRLSRMGAALLKSTVYVLPNGAEALEDFTWLAREIHEAGGSLDHANGAAFANVSHVDFHYRPALEPVVFEL